MLAMTAAIVDYTFKNVFLTFYILQAGPPNRREAQAQVTYTPTLPLDRPGCVNNALKN